MAIRLAKVDLMMHDLILNGNGDLLCPKCNFDHMHLTKVDTKDEWASLVFYCEGCGMHGDQRLTFNPNKGRVSPYWEEGKNLGPWLG